MEALFESTTEIRVRYAETDRMGYVYYGNYATYFEVARVEAIKKLGLSYRALEDSGIMLPVLQYSIKFYKPAFYDDLLKINTRITLCKGTRIVFDYTVLNEDGQVLSQADTTLVFISAATKKPIAVPEILLSALSNV
jgi:acyl-CoA thioester hydrolase